MRIYRYMTVSLLAFMAGVAAMADTLIARTSEVVLNIADFAFTSLARTLDYIMPMPLALSGTCHPLVAGREVSYMTTGLHRMAQPKTRLGDPNDDEGGDDGGDDDDEIAGHMRN